MKKGVFGFDEEDEGVPEVKLPKGAKLSKNLGRDTQTSFSQTKPSPALMPSAPGNWIQDSKQHPRHRPVDKYFADKEELQKKAEEEMAKEKQQEKAREKLRIDDINQLLASIKKELDKVHVCLICKKKFATLEYYIKHKETSENHKEAAAMQVE